jgi:hypothetical protein
MFRHPAYPHCCVLLLGALACHPAHADTETETGTDPSLVIEKNAQSYVVDRDGSYTLTVDDVRLIALPRAVQAHGQH